ncbi:MAG: adenylosuccinate lyase [Candidatus Melainabacteria bacterium RIFCSPLOWO2_02_FULL_35_15]|nr:MAG: adenylosuccinate lyase [Candidatus Melainabacteria bacterium RIFCSPLOWO2_02_FULL_35_15]
MIQRYTRPELAKIWSEENKYNVWLSVEIAAAEALCELGQVSRESLSIIKERAKFDIKRIEEIDKEVHHDVIAFLTCLTESIGPDGRFLHLGMTSSDLVDTSFAILLKQAGKKISDGLNKFLSTLQKKAIEHKNTICIGRTHGVHAEPTTFGLKLLGFWEGLNRAKKRFQFAMDEINVGMFSGAVGTYSNINPRVEEIATGKLGLKPAPLSTQVISRDRHALYLNELALIATMIERIATEIRHLQRTEVLEAEEPFYENQKGSSAMPHKRNPWRSENLCGLARLVRAYSLSAMENIPLWHERDISHSSVERIILPDATTLIDFMLDRVNQIISDLNVYPENMKENMFKFGGVIFSQTVLLKLVEAGLEREAAYKLIQKNAHNAWNKKDGDFKRNILSDKEVLKYLSPNIIEECFDPKKHLKHVDTVFNRVLEQKDLVGCKR